MGYSILRVQISIFIRSERKEGGLRQGEGPRLQQVTKGGRIERMRSTLNREESN